ncbi:uncharacterized protein LOC132739119 [Ruditapes philippinarum]|uniref:uncharacterized protein LOC132739119 n=1 Tax=Ruditapes philippinarum TaxID=129788 RepID=UPI00295C21FE|nr:uncharacterized protein LOC132739119 [Ruditapes philippinarum]
MSKMTTNNQPEEFPNKERTRSFDGDVREETRRNAIRMRRQVGFQRLNQLSFMQIITSCPLFIAGVVTLVMALPHVEYPVFNFGPVFVSILVFPMALIGLLATRSATENVNEIETTGGVKCMIVCNFILSLLCSVLAAASSFFSFYIVEQCSDTSSDFYELCLPNSRANIGLSLVDGVVCIILLILSVFGIAHFCTHGFKLCFPSDPLNRNLHLTVVMPCKSSAQDQVRGFHERNV